MTPPRIEYEIDGERRVARLTGDELRIGRERSNDIVVGRPYISRWHARVYRGEEGWRVENLSTTSRIQVNGRETRDAPLEHGDRIFLLDLCFTFLEAGEAAPPEFRDSEVALTTESENTSTVFRPVVDFSDLGSDSGDPSRLQELLSVLGRTSRALLTTTEVDDLFEIVLDTVFDHMPAQRGGIMLWDEGREELVTRCVRHRSETDGGQIHFSRTIAERVCRNKESVLTLDAQRDDRFAAGGSVIMQGIRSAMAAPLWRGEEVDGLIYVDTTEEAEAFDQYDLDLLSAMGNHVAVAIDHSRLQHTLMQQQLMRRRLERYHSPAVIDRIAEGLGASEETLDAEEREVTILFADLVDFTPLCEALTPREVSDLLNHYFSEMTEVVFRHEGTLDKFIGDSLMAVFGAPLDAPDHARRAVDAAIEMREALRELNEVLPPESELHFRVGIHTGRVIAGDIGSIRRSDYTVLGATVNVAARLESSVALPDRIVISDVTREAVTGVGYGIRFAGDRKLKGISRIVGCYEVLNP